MFRFVHHLNGRPKRVVFTPLLLLPALLLPFSLYNHSITAPTAGAASPTPAPDPLAVPVLPENPSEIDLGRVTYYYHCMPCHGDKGQGLTDEWRGVWVEDHQDCWSRGCHGGKPNDLGFPIPRDVPPIMPPFSSLARFASTDDLIDFLHVSHPPQNPGILNEAASASLAAYLTRSLPQDADFQLSEATRAPEVGAPTSALVTRALIALAATLGVAWLIGSKESG